MPQPDPQQEIACLQGSIRTLKDLLEHVRGLLAKQTKRAEAAEARAAGLELQIAKDETDEAN